MPGLFIRLCLQSNIESIESCIEIDDLIQMSVPSGLCHDAHELGCCPQEPIQPFEMSLALRLSLIRQWCQTFLHVLSLALLKEQSSEILVDAADEHGLI